MSKLQKIFDRILVSKKEQKELKLMYKDALAQNRDYQIIQEKIKELTAKRKIIQDEVEADFRGEFNKLETLKLDIENDNMLLSDLALTMYTKGEKVEVVDARGIKYDPSFSAKFKKN